MNAYKVKSSFDREFKVNEFISLKLKNGKTKIYVNKENFIQCKYLLLINPHKKEIQKDINSIDEASEKLINELESEIHPSDLGITPEEEFWGHCSNLQAWVENGYDTRLIHRNLAFPLLKKLSEIGDSKAKYILKEEIAKRLESGYPSLVNFLKKEGYLKYLSHKEQIIAMVELEEANALLEIESQIQKKFTIDEDLSIKSNYRLIKLEKKHIISISLRECNLRSIPKEIFNFKKLKILELYNNHLTKLPSELINLSYLEIIDIEKNQIKILPDWILDFKFLKELWRMGNPITRSSEKKVIIQLEKKGIYLD